MDNFCTVLQRLGQWLETGASPVIPYIGQTGGRFFNPPRPHLEMVYTVTGSFPELRVGDLQVSIPPGHVTLHSVHFGNYSPPPTPGTMTWCLFFDVAGTRIFSGLEKAPLFLCMPVSRPQALEGAFRRIQQWCRLPGTRPPEYINGPVAFTPDGVDVARHLRVRAALLDLIAELLDNAALASGDSAQPSLPPPVVAAQEFIVARYASALSLEEIARAASLSIDHFGRLFKQHTGLTPMQYLRETRINQSRFLLAHTGLRVEEIAAQVGFDDGFHFSRVFSAVTGRSPSAFRRDHQDSSGKVSNPSDLLPRIDER